MKYCIHLIFVLGLYFPSLSLAQSGKVTVKEDHIDQWEVVNRKMTITGDVLILDAMPSNGLAIIKESNFRNGTIEIDIKGKDVQGESFVGVAFHGVNDSTYDAVYFRPFNFRSPERKHHSVQYISHPVFTWYKLREEHTGEYEKEVNPVPDPNDWFHATLVIDYPSVKVYVNHSDEPSLVVKQLSAQSSGFVGLWVGNGSDGSFRNLEIAQH